MRRLILVRRAREIGFSIEEITELMTLQPGIDGTDVQNVIRKRLESIERKLEELHQWRAALCALQVVHANGGAIEGFLDRQLADLHASDRPQGH